MLGHLPPPIFQSLAASEKRVQRGSRTVGMRKTFRFRVGTLSKDRILAPGTLHLSSELPTIICHRIPPAT